MFEIHITQDPVKPLICECINSCSVICYSVRVEELAVVQADEYLLSIIILANRV